MRIASINKILRNVSKLQLPSGPARASPRASPFKLSVSEKFPLGLGFGFFRTSFRSSFGAENVAMSAEANVAVQYLEVPDKSEHDKKEYKTLKLPNGLTVLLVSDPSPIPEDEDDGDDESSCKSSEDSCAEESAEDDDDDDDEHSTADSTSTEDEDSDMEYDSDEEGDEKLAACALLIDVGSFSDPKEYQGLAHFLEHMIFMGSKKYPSENAFDSHIKKCGGFDNADTECEETNFYFEVTEEHLDSSIERFVALFEAPLVKKEGMARERDAVESEFQQALPDDEARRDQLLASLAKDSHPASTFTYGNLKSLKENVDDDALHARLHDFRKRHYSAHRMYACIQARLPIEDLEKIAVKHFSKIPRNDELPDDFTAFSDKNAFTDEFHKNVLYVKPISDVCKLEFTWCLPSVWKSYLNKPDHFMSYMIGYEGPGSLCAYLRKKLWCLDMMAGVNDSGFDSNSMYCLFNICICLTEEGFNHLKEVIEATSSFLKLFETAGPYKDSYVELQYIEEASFRFRPQRSAYDNVQSLVNNMKYYPTKYILTGPELYFEYNEDEIQKFIRSLRDTEFNIMITSDKKHNGIVYDKKEKWFGTEYASVARPKEWQKLWDEAKPIAELFIPKPNIFVSKDFHILNENGLSDVATYPKKIMDSDVCELWFKQDDRFLLPDAFMYFYFITPLPLLTAKNAVVNTLYMHLIKFKLVEELYPATVAGLNYEFFSSEKGLVLKASGYNEKLHLIVEIFAKAMNYVKDEINEDQLQIFIKQQRKNYYNSLIKPKSLAKDIRLGIIENIRWPMYKKFNLLSEVTLYDVKEYAKAIFIEMRVQALVQGNLTEESAHNVMNSILTHLNCARIKDETIIESRACQLPEGSNYLLCKSLNENDVNTVVCNFYQIGPCTLRTECVLDLLMMFVEEPLFDNLRTKEQLGYDVSSSVRMNFGIAGYTITVNSQENKFTSGYVEQRIEDFRTKMMQILSDMDDAEYQHVRESLIKIKLVADTSLAEEVSRNWGEITCGEYLFDRRRREADCLRTIEKQDVLKFCMDNEGKQLKKLSVQVVGNRNPPATDDDQTDSKPDSDEKLSRTISLEMVRDNQSTVDDIESFKQRLVVYPVTKTLIDFPPTAGANEIIETSI